MLPRQAGYACAALTLLGHLLSSAAALSANGDNSTCLQGQSVPSSAADVALEILLRLPKAERQRVIEAATPDDRLNGLGDDESVAEEIDSSWVGASFLTCCLAVVAYFVHLLYEERVRFAAIKHKQFNFSGYLMYRFGCWYAWTPGASGIVLCALSLALLVFGGISLRALTGEPVSSALWSAWIWIAAPDGGDSQDTPLGKFIGLLVSCGGMMIFAMLMSVVSAKLEEMLQGLHEGSGPVIEHDHYVILGWNPMVPTLIEELCNAVESEEGKVIALLSPQPKVEVEEMFRDLEVNFRNSTVVVRCGDRSRHEDLAKVAVEHAAKVVVLSKPGVSREDADARTSNVLLTMRTMGWPRHGSVVVQCQLARNQRLFQNICVSPSTQILVTSDFVCQLMVQSSQQSGIASVVKSIFGFQGSEFYITQVAGTASLSFRELLFAIQGVIVCGLVPPEGPMELPPLMDRELTGDEQLIMLAEDDSTLPRALSDMSEALGFGSYRPKIKSPRNMKRAASGHHQNAELVVVIGWNEGLGAILNKMDSIIRHGSRVIIYTPKAEADRVQFLDNAQRRRNHRYQHLVIEHRTGELGARFNLEELPLETASKLFVLADDSAATSREADGHTVAVILQVLDILAERSGGKRGCVIVPQILELESHSACMQLGIPDFIDTNMLAARILALVSQNPEVSPVICEILAGTQCQFRICELREYPHASRSSSLGVTFDEVAAAAASVGDVALGWSEHEAGASGPWEMNPTERHVRRPWTAESRIVSLRPVSPENVEAGTGLPLMEGPAETARVSHRITPLSCAASLWGPRSPRGRPT